MSSISPSLNSSEIHGEFPNGIGAAVLRFFGSEPVERLDVNANLARNASALGGTELLQFRSDVG